MYRVPPGTSPRWRAAGPPKIGRDPSETCPQQTASGKTADRPKFPEKNPARPRMRAPGWSDKETYAGKDRVATKAEETGVRPVPW